MDYLLHLVVLVSIYLILAASVDLLVGHTGILSLAQAAFYGTGAYATAVVAVVYGVSPVLAAGAGLLVAGTLGVVLSIVTANLEGDYLAVATFGYGIIFVDLANNWESLTLGPQGIRGIPFPSLFGLAVDTELKFAIASCSLALISLGLIWLTANSPFGRVLRTLREDEDVARVLGRNPIPFKVSVFALAGILSALAGSLYAHHVTYVSPTSFGVMESVLLVSMVIIGGPGRLLGAVVGATTLVLLPEALRFAGLPAPVAAQLRQILYGVLLIVVLIFRPSGLVGRYRLRV